VQEGNNTRYLLTQFGAMSPTFGGISARKKIHCNSIKKNGHTCMGVSVLIVTKVIIPGANTLKEVDHPCVD